MRKSYFPWINGSLVVASLFILLLFFFSSLFFVNPPFEQPMVSKKNNLLPKNAFQAAKESYKQFVGPAFILNEVAPDLFLPDLRSQINYLGANQRPDSTKETQQLYFSIGDARNVYSAKPGEKIYLRKENGTRSFILSPNNTPTSLWIVAKPQAKGVLIDVFLLGIRGQRVTEPRDRVQFFLPEKNLSAKNTVWNIGNQKVDSTLLFRQKASWRGEDLFLKLHGGQEFSYTINKQRIDFAVGEEGHYFIFAAPGDYFIWKHDQWRAPNDKESTENFPLLSVRKADEKTLALEVWAVGGKSKMSLTLVRLPDPMPNQEAILHSFEFLGARTKVHFMFNVDGVREIVGPGDWFILLNGKWKKMKKAKDVDLYVEGILIGPLLVINKEQSSNDRKLSVQLFNASRTNMIEMDLPLRAASLLDHRDGEQMEEKEVVNPTMNHKETAP